MRKRLSMTGRSFRIAGAMHGLILALSLATTGCGRRLVPVAPQGTAAIALSGGGNTSMTYVARTGEGVLVIDLGWWGHAEGLHLALQQIGATPADVRHVFLTHSHRDHIGAWPMVADARFHVGASELPLLHGVREHGGWIARWADRLMPPELPAPARIAVQSFSRDTAFVVGSDTVYAYLVPGHTPGSAVYLFRGILFLGDAVTWSRTGGFRPAKRGFTDDRQSAIASLAKLWRRLPPGAARYVCTAHAHCAEFSPEFVDQVSAP